MTHDVAPFEKGPVYAVWRQLMLLVCFMQGWACGVIILGTLFSKTTEVVVH